MDAMPSSASSTDCTAAIMLSATLLLRYAGAEMPFAV